MSSPCSFVDSGETSVWAPYLILAKERLRKSEKATKGRRAGGAFAKERPPASKVWFLVVRPLVDGKY